MNKSPELIKDIEGFESVYAFTEPNKKGIHSIWSYPRGSQTKGRIVKEILHTDGYLIVGLYKDGVKKAYYVHILICQAFVPLPPNYPILDPKNAKHALVPGIVSL